MENHKIRNRATLMLEDGTRYEAYHFGAPVSSSGEVVFNTAMTGYTESMTDPSYRGQILTYTYPIIGNYGIPSSSCKESIFEFYESDRIQVSGLILSYYSNRPYHWNMSLSLSDWLLKHGVPGLYGIDTRFIAKKLRKKGGSMLGKILMENEDLPFYDPNQDNLSEKVSIHEKITYGNGKYKILLVDFGLKNNILRCLLRRDCTVIRVPWDYDFTSEKYDGLVLSNGPGNPKIYEKPIHYIRIAMKEEQPIFGICLGNQLLGIAAGGDTYKLKYAHRSHNQPVILLKTGKSFITSQNHGFVLDAENLPKEWKIFFKNLNDDTCEGIIHDSKPFFSVQFHPEASSGPTDTEFLFDLFINSIVKSNK
ncbi:carbamoyl phosphate synthase small subunit [Blattabacterium sp. (Blattella germanica) str. Bge]|uniref:glutamine-hydrolyzing carbamoyl-phosphate synthase small subunit n=1 Tax=Blattabacterium sp. (Blattella germanica) TaxID=624186 RepID=UPI0001BB617F|nr:glutamine-hydrolyzing carbamoyl-phosphate synthase small subunit [Blattabacterium sp. (Blattella germanica)]ACY40329.1 carbamoyl phosphate synthase small subunit [Blattabacterium sp. (Blattella germanica) str. Bge]